MTANGFRDSKVRTSNGRTIVTTVHVSKRGKPYKRRRIVQSDITVPSWWRR